MNTDSVVGAIASIAMLIYLVYTLLRPERF
jgi:K+-transporting ATPase KdpF subunit